MKISVNGNDQVVSEACTLEQLLHDLKIDKRYCAVERNRRVVPREIHHECVLQAGDEIEIVTLVGGG
jgi:sulfur carrier protein